ncbi:MAG: hypothetical protein ACJAUP_001231 [Cellvibrionaceae bacterium]|jgi:hypothetical protein
MKGLDDHYSYKYDHKSHPNLSSLEDALRVTLEMSIAKVIKEPSLALVPEHPNFEPFWRVKLLGLGSQLFFEFSIMFSQEQVISFVPVHGRVQSTGARCADFVKEICNVLSGRIQAYFLEYDIHTGLSLPILSRGFDRYLANSNDLKYKSTFSARWKVVSHSGYHLFSTELLLKPFKPLLLEEVAFSSPGPTNDDDQIELL